jgi:hypothetical protein
MQTGIPVFQRPQVGTQFVTTITDPHNLKGGADTTPTPVITLIEFGAYFKK